MRGALCERCGREATFTNLVLCFKCSPPLPCERCKHVTWSGSALCERCGALLPKNEPAPVGE